MAAVAASNAVQPEWLIERLATELGGRAALSGARIALLGLTFKAGTDDLRESRAMIIARRLHELGAQVVVHDPLALDAALVELRSSDVPVIGAPDVAGAFDGADAVVIATEWPAYATIDWRDARARMAGDLVCDSRAIVDVERATDAGLRVVVHGRARMPRVGIALSPDG